MKHAFESWKMNYKFSFMLHFFNCDENVINLHKHPRFVNLFLSISFNF